MYYTLFTYLFSFAFLLTSSVSKLDSNPIKVPTERTPCENQISFLYNSLHTKKFSIPNLKSFTEAIKGFYTLKSKGMIAKNILTLIDYSLPSNEKRLWVIDMATNTILINSLVAHGINSGGVLASNFSNKNQSNQSSLGFYLTGEVYGGKNGFSLKLDGLEKGVNSNARARAIVMHGADYANENILNSQNYLGRSQGCPALPEAINKKVIDIIKGKSCLFIYHPSRVSIYAKQLLS